MLLPFIILEITSLENTCSNVESLEKQHIIYLS